ncbi:MAG: hypothetical protein U5L01_08015 [Rheinheimera sp.]|nr:hypothetical protein [Rheinheimera sp.]
MSGKIDILIDDPYAVEDMLSKFQLQRKDIEFVYYIPQLQQTTWIAIHKDSSPENWLRNSKQDISMRGKLRRLHSDATKRVTYPIQLKRRVQNSSGAMMPIKKPICSIGFLHFS